MSAHFFSRRAWAAAAFSVALLPAGLFAQQPGESAPLTPSQVEAIKKKLSDLRKGVTDLNLKKNGSAEQVFRQASSDPNKAVELYLMCYKELNFTRLNKEEREFREWQDANADQFKFEPFAKALQLQLHYLSLVTRAAQQEQLSAIFGDLTAFMNGLQTLTEPPHPYLNSDISQSLFAEVYDLDEALRRKEDTWELNPMNIGGIYEKTILPHLRQNNPGSVENAWSSRIQQETNMAQLFLSFEDGMERFQERTERTQPGAGPRGGGGGRNELARMAQFVRVEAKKAERFEEETLPVLNWGKARDQFQYGSRAFGAKAMLDLIEANLGHPNAELWIEELNNLVNGTGAAAPAAVPGT